MRSRSRYRERAHGAASDARVEESAQALEQARRVGLALLWLRQVPLAPLTADGMVKGILMAEALDAAAVSDELATLAGALWSLDGALGGAGFGGPRRGAGQGGRRGGGRGAGEGR